MNGFIQKIDRRSNLPFIPLDEEYSLNLSIMVIIIANMSKNSKGNLVLDMNKLQVFLYLVKNPSRIISILNIAGKKNSFIDQQQTYTIKSLSSNVDILYDNNRIKCLIKKLAFSGVLLADKIEDNTVKLYLSDKGLALAEKFDGAYFETLKMLVLAIKPLQSLPASKLNSLLNQVFRGV
ncbi:ABC-three component system middle component 4 [Serratia ureilytica]|uniref:ABC-three component system middle component 4 n=2 Tax=Serratia TaxID=613 RepID=UPI003FA73FED